MTQRNTLGKSDTQIVFERLRDVMPGRTIDAKGPKDQPDPFRSCISCMLSAQSLDKNTAAATRALFSLAKTPNKMLELEDSEIAEAIKPCGLYNNKTRNIRRFCEALLQGHGGVVPQTREGLMSLPGIGRKCADIVMSFTFDADVIAVDTHVHRVCNRIGLTTAKTAEQTAVQLEQNAPSWAHRDGHFWLIQFGKSICKARKPLCEKCPVSGLCQWYLSQRYSNEIQSPGNGQQMADRPNDS